MKTVELKIVGMSCNGCVKHATEALNGVDGVISAQVSLPNKGVVSMNDDTALEAIIEALDQEGYTATPAEAN